MESFADWVQFGVAALVVVLFLAIVLLQLVLLARKGKAQSGKDRLKLKSLNDELKETRRDFLSALLKSKEFETEMKGEAKREKERLKAEAKAEKERKKDCRKGEVLEAPPRKRRLFVVDFNGDIAASANDNLRRQITGILQVATAQDEVLVRVESGGGMVHAYGLASSQLLRVREHGIKLTAAVDKVAASGGYMMACVADRVIAAPFAIIGSIGVISSIPNFNRVLRKNDVDYIEMTAGEYKRTLTLFGEVTDKGKEKHREQIELIHTLFKEHVRQYRPKVEISEVATGEYWPATLAQGKHLVDEITTSDEYLIRAAADANVYQVELEEKRSFKDKLLRQFRGAVLTLIHGAEESGLPVAKVQV
jgi:serine protease SohB